MNFLSRVLGIFFNPGEVFGRLSEKPIWVDVLVLILVALTVFSYIVAPYQQQDQANLMESNLKLRERMGDERFEQILEETRTPHPTRRILGAGLAPVTMMIGFLISTLFLMLFGRMVSSHGRYVEILAVNIHANLIDKLLGNAVRLFLILSRKSLMQTSTGLAMFFPKLEVTSSAYLVLTQIDFFQLWMFGVMGLGLARVFKIERGKAFLISYGFWLLKTALTAAITLLSMSLMS